MQQEMVCDFSDDCGDNSDENNCGKAELQVQNCLKTKYSAVIYILPHLMILFICLTGSSY